MPEAAGALMTGNVLLSGGDGPTFTASPTRPPTTDRTLEQDTTGGGHLETRGWRKSYLRRHWKDKCPQQLMLEEEEDTGHW